MDEKERQWRTTIGQQNSSLEYIKYFCICDCITLGMPEGYTAMGAGLELFLDKFQPGKKYIQPFAMKLPKDKMKHFRPFAYKVPKKIDAFLWSPFHDALSSYWDLGDDCRHSYRFKGQLLKQLDLAKRLKAPSLETIKKHLRLMDKKVNKIWDNPKKILVFYDHSRLRDGPAKNKLKTFNKMAKNILKWPIAQMELTEYDAKDKSEKDIKSWWGWEHYSRESRDLLYSKIKQLVEG